MPEVGSDINFRNGRLNETMLHIVTRSGHTSCMKVLLDSNADVNCIGKLFLFIHYLFENKLHENTVHKNIITHLIMIIVFVCYDPVSF
jgi:ankyrin repeat protein